jgi:tetratricopeptide (TPR) repeat protein
MIKDKSLENKIKILVNLFNNKKFLEAILKAKQLMKKIPSEQAYFLNIIGLSYYGLNKLDDAKKSFVKTIEQFPGNLQSKLNYAMVLKAENNFDEAEIILKKTIKQDSNYINAINNLANLKRERKHYDEAVKLYTDALKINSEIPIIHYNLALCLISLRKKNEALVHAKIVNKLNPKFTYADKIISDFTDYSKDKSDHLLAMEKKILINDLDIDQKVCLHFSLGKAYEDKKLFKSSFKHYELANKTKRLSLDYEFDEEKTFNLIKKLFEKVKKNNFETESIPKQSKRIIFICGMPRSGTTLLEQVISSHHKVYSLGETDYVHQITKNMLSSENFDKVQEQFSSKKENSFLNQYYKHLSDQKNKKDIFTDKSLLNFKFIGFIKTFLPDSKIIILKRNYEDNLLSIYKNLLPSNELKWSFSEDEIFKFHQIFLEYVEYWKKMLPDSFLEIEYEDLVQNTLDETKKILDYCNLEWDDNCLKYHETNTSAIETASANQANKPVYKNSLNKFENFKNFFKKKPPYSK